MNHWQKTKLDPEQLVATVLRQPGIDIGDLTKTLATGVNEVYKTLAKLKDDPRICQNGNFMIDTLDGPLSYQLLDELIREAAMKRADITKAVRLGKTMDILNHKTPTGGVTVKELSERFDVSEKTIKRDIEDMEKLMDVEIIRSEQPGKPTKYLLKRVYLPSMSPEKAVIIFLSLLQQQGSALTGHINDIKEALITNLFKNRYTAQSLEIEKLQGRIYIIEEALTDPAQVGELFSKIIEAMKNNNKLKMWYYTVSRGKESVRVVEPYGLVCKRQNWYLVGCCHKSSGVRTFRVDQIRDIHMYVHSKFVYPDNFSLKEHMGQAWGVIRDDHVCCVKIRFKAPVVHMPRTITYHSSQKIEEELPDGSVIVTFEVCGLAELTGWIIQWGDHVEVLEPQELRERVRETVLRIANMYV